MTAEKRLQSKNLTEQKITLLKKKTKTNCTYQLWNLPKHLKHRSTLLLEGHCPISNLFQLVIIRQSWRAWLTASCVFELNSAGQWPYRSMVEEKYEMAEIFFYFPEKLCIHKCCEWTQCFLYYPLCRIWTRVSSMESVNKDASL